MINCIIRVYSWQKSSQSLYDVYWTWYSVSCVLRTLRELRFEPIATGWKGAAAGPCEYAWPRIRDGQWQRTASTKFTKYVPSTTAPIRFQFLLLLQTGMEFVMVLAIIIFIGFFLAFRPKHTYNQAPRIIWTYWEEPDHLDPYKRMTDEAKTNIQRWRTLNPEYKIVILTKKTYQGYVTIPEDLRENPTFVPDHFPSLLKLWTLAEHGGVWVDPTYPLEKPLDDWMFPKYAEFAGIKNREISTRFFAANKGCKFIEAWKNEFSEAVRFPNMEKYMADRTKVLSSTYREPIQVAVQTVLQKYPTDSLMLHGVQEGLYTT